jgi:long-chain acyl-CoA synthetase
VHDKINSSSPAMKKIFLDAIETGRRYNLEYKNKGIPAPCGLKLKFEFYNRTVFMLLKKVLGIERGRLFPVAGAPLSDTINEFLQSVNIPIAYGYGLSETTATVCFYPEIGFQFGSIGEVMPDVQVRIDPENSEILVKGKTVMSGYYNKPAENKKAFTEDGFFRTGDAGRLEGNTLFFTERIKDLYKTSNGKYIAPQAIEMAMSGDNFIEQIAVIGDQRKFVSALIVPAYSLLEEYAGEKRLTFNSREELVNHKEILRLIETHVEEHQKNLASYEKIKRFTLLPEPFMMGCELTDTLKLRRPIVLQKYAEQIEAMYAE